MREPRRGRPERAVQLQLARGRAEQVVGAEHVGDPARGVVDHHRELVAGDARRGEHREVADRRRDVLRVGAVDEVLEPLDAGLDPEPERRRPLALAARPLLAGEVGAGAGVARPVVGRPVRRRGGAGDLRAGAEARVDPARGPEPVDCGEVERAPLRLVEHLAVPPEAQVLEIGEEVVDERLLRAHRVEVLDPEQELAPGALRLQPPEQRGAGVAEVKPSGRAGSEASAHAGLFSPATA